MQPYKALMPIYLSFQFLVVRGYTICRQNRHKRSILSVKHLFPHVVSNSLQSHLVYFLLEAEMSDEAHQCGVEADTSD